MLLLVVTLFHLPLAKPIIMPANLTATTFLTEDPPFKTLLRADMSEFCLPRLRTTSPAMAPWVKV